MVTIIATFKYRKVRVVVSDSKQYKIMTRIIIAGGRDFQDYPYLEQMLLPLFDLYSDIEIVSGQAKGADRLGENFAQSYNLPVKYFPAQWDLYGKGAGFKRNNDMANYADIAICFWNGMSTGTRHMINTAKDKGLYVCVYTY